MSDTNIEYQEHSIDAVIGYFAKAFKATDGRRIIQYEAYLCERDNRVIFKLYLETPKEKPC